MITPEVASEAAEKAIMSYSRELNLQTAEDLKHAFEMLISKAARGIEKYCGTDEAVKVVFRTGYRIIEGKKSNGIDQQSHPHRPSRP